jgi:transcriptional regulator with XRE-family HTH domain
MNGATLRTYRELLGYELNQYAEKVGVNRRTVTRWETGQWNVPEDVATQVRSDLDELNRVIDELHATIPEAAEEATLLRCGRSDDLSKVTKETTSHEIYNAATGLTALALETEGCQVTLEWSSRD